ncbi:MAG: dihydrodipicolinate synthase family protein, partial [Armatimonadetes bacterium]|nr:dihydrodipicolinate synthase family protein [Armatimonadota bacterium]
SSIPPFPFPVSQAATLEHWTRIGRATDLPLWIYYLPAMTGFRVADAQMEALLGIPNLAGLQFTDPNLYVMRNLIDLSGGRLRILSGPDELCLPAQVMGASGAIGSTYNWMAPLFVGLYRAWRAGDLAAAQAAQWRANGLIRLILRHEIIAGQKVIMEYLGVSCGPTRHPIRPLGEPERRALFEALDREGRRGLYHTGTV